MYRLLVENFRLFIQSWISELLILSVHAIYIFVQRSLPTHWMHLFVLFLRLYSLNIDHRISVNRLLNFIQDNFFLNRPALVTIYTEKMFIQSLFCYIVYCQFSSPCTHSIKNNGIKSKKNTHLITDAYITEVIMYVRRMRFWKIHITVVCTLFNDAVRNSRVCNL